MSLGLGWMKGEELAGAGYEHPDLWLLSQMSPYDNLLLCQPVSSPLPLRYVTKWQGVVGGFENLGYSRRYDSGVYSCYDLCTLALVVCV